MTQNKSMNKSIKSSPVYNDVCDEPLCCKGSSLMNYIDELEKEQTITDEKIKTLGRRLEFFSNSYPTCDKSCDKMPLEKQTSQFVSILKSRIEKQKELNIQLDTLLNNLDL